MHRTTIGDFELTVVSDGTYVLDGGAFFGVVPKTMWARRAAPDEQNRLDAGLNSLLIRTGSKNILVETGIGNKLPEKLVQIYKQPARLLENLHAAGVAPEDSTSLLIPICISITADGIRCGAGMDSRLRFRRRSITRRAGSGNAGGYSWSGMRSRSEEHTSELQSPTNLVCRLLLENKKHTCGVSLSHPFVAANQQRLLSGRSG